MTCYTLTSVFDLNGSIIFCKDRTQAQSCARAPLNILRRSSSNGDVRFRSSLPRLRIAGTYETCTRRLTYRLAGARAWLSLIEAKTT